MIKVVLATMLGSLGAFVYLRFGDNGSDRLVGAIFVLVTFAGIMNSTAMVVNGGRMPVFSVEERYHADLQKSTVHQLATPETRLAWLCDWIPVGETRISLGDIVLGVASGIWLLFALSYLKAMLL